MLQSPHCILRQETAVLKVTLVRGGALATERTEDFEAKVYPSTISNSTCFFKVLGWATAVPPV
ncbi:MAG: hypothetical protein KC449_15735 [Anaerolineales bacterium]|nr:hypothetical protein [Anaerolineales bacterium]